MMTNWVLIGLMVGSILGVSGAGGAVIAVPLFMHLTGASLRDSTVLSLVVVAMGALLNWWYQRSHTVYRVAIPLFIFSVAGSYLTRPLKALTPEWGIVLLFVLVAVLSLLSIWKNYAPLKGSMTNQIEWPKIAVSGLGFGVLVTMTGLGGGVILAPLLKKVFNIPYSQVAASSLILIFLGSISSLVLQWSEVANLIAPETIAALAIGSVASAIFVHTVLNKVEPMRLELLRKSVLTAVLLFSILSVGYPILMR